MPIGGDITATRAEYNYLDLKTLLTYAYGVRVYQITGPDWMANTRFDIVAKLPAGSTKADAQKMLQSLLKTASNWSRIAPPKSIRSSPSWLAKAARSSRPPQKNLFLLTKTRH